MVALAGLAIAGSEMSAQARGPVERPPPIEQRPPIERPPPIKWLPPPIDPGPVDSRSCGP